MAGKIVEDSFSQNPEGDFSSDLPSSNRYQKPVQIPKMTAGSRTPVSHDTPVTNGQKRPWKKRDTSQHRPRQNL
jgi:hypothetical protein